MKLFFSPGACSLASHIILAETGLPYSLEQVNLKDKTCSAGNFLSINQKGCVPFLTTEGKQTFSEGAVILQYIADQKPELNLVPKWGTADRYKAMEWLNYIASEFHRSYSPFFNAAKIFNKDSAEYQTYLTAMTTTLATKMDYVSNQLAKQDYVMGSNFTIVDAYLFTCLSWSKHINFDLAKWPNITAYMDRVYKRPAVQKAMKEEGILN